MCGKEVPTRDELAALLVGDLSKPILDAAYAFCNKKFVALGGDDDVARGSDFIAGLRTSLPKFLKLKSALKVKTQKTK